ncbi:MAG: type IV pilus secretin PilQ [Elusimicrobia bacterium]|nr:type IV pilus secretin PilQ [Elusimicrobiota bacterium]
MTASSLAVTAVASSTAPATPLVQTPPLTVSASTPTTPAPLPVKEAPAQPTEAKKSVTLPTSPVTLDFVDADVRDVLQVLSVKSGINIVYGSDVTGTVTVHLENVPFDQAFQTVLTLRGLVAAPAGDNILRVITSAALTTERSQAVTFTKVFSLRYAKGTDLKTQLDAIRGAEGRKGTITLDPATSSLVVTDTPEGLQQAERHIRELDRPPSQVSIEAKIIEVALGKSLDLGVDWGYARTTSRQGNTITVGGSDVVPPTGPGAGINTPGGPTGRIALPGGGSSGLGLLQGAGVATSGQTPAGGVFSFGVLGASSQLDVVLKALAKKSNTKILSNPRIITLNNQEAKILVGDRIPYTITNVSPGQGQTQSTQFVEVGVKLAVTPTINVDKRITLKIRPEVSQAKTITPGQAPQVSTREAETVIMIRNGETVVIGGLIKEQTDKTASQVPLLGDIPVIGQLFKTSSNSKTRTELLVFVTPTVVEE